MHLLSVVNTVSGLFFSLGARMISLYVRVKIKSKNKREDRTNSRDGQNDRRYIFRIPVYLGSLYLFTWAKFQNIRRSWMLAHFLRNTTEEFYKFEETRVVRCVYLIRDENFRTFVDRGFLCFSEKYKWNTRQMKPFAVNIFDLLLRKIRRKDNVEKLNKNVASLEQMESNKWSRDQFRERVYV